ncbi:MAG: hypothetical protein FWC28_06140 [Proteobacteria bacterium]|nr:hypothetical protein [Cystobacterineae bacterium]MCL2314813.1 hypothetical protein [Pseudomonadota bacterium]
MSEAKKEKDKEEGCEAVLMAPSLAVGLGGYGTTDRFPAFEGVDLEMQEVNVLLERASRLLELDNYSGAIELISRAEELAPEHPRVARLKLRSETTLLAVMESRLGDLEAIPFIKLRDEEILWLNLGRKADFVLERMDGQTNLGQLLSLPGMSRLELARILNQLLDNNVIDMC